MIKIFFLFLLLSASAYAQVNTVVSILPQKYFVNQIGGDKVSVEVMVTPGSSPVTYEPKPSQMTALSGADLYFSMDVPFEKRWLPRFQDAAQNTVFVDTAKGIQKRPIDTHDHGHDSHRDHDTKQNLDPHIWLSPTLAKTIAAHIKDALVEADKTNAAFYENNYKRFLQKIEALDTRIKNLLQNRNSDKFIVFHPSWGYFARDYGLTQVPVEIEGKAPKQKDLIQLIDFAKENEIKAVFVAPEFSQKSAQTIAESIGGKTITVSPLSP
ncbi:MAG: metal ABC transporter solute-binding protein, Zn/Mn family, partial [Campylobacterota bacterium]